MLLFISSAVRHNDQIKITTAVKQNVEMIQSVEQHWCTGSASVFVKGLLTCQMLTHLSWQYQHRLSSFVELFFKNDFIMWESQTVERNRVRRDWQLEKAKSTDLSRLLCPDECKQLFKKKDVSVHGALPCVLVAVGRLVGSESAAAECREWEITWPYILSQCHDAEGGKR